MKEFKPEWIDCIKDLLNIAITHARNNEYVTVGEVYHALIASGTVVTEENSEQR